MNVHVGHTVRLIRRAVETLSPQAKEGQKSSS
jgi:hypothetical protein